MRHIYIRGIIGLIWLVAAIVCGISGNFPMMGLYIVLEGPSCIPHMRHGKRKGRQSRDIIWEKRS